MRNKKLLYWITISLLISAGVAPGQKAPSHPNIILILSDDIGYGDLACYGSPVADTPNLDQLRDNSVSFSDYHASPMCTPTRSALMTGKDPIRTGGDFVCMGRSLPRADLQMAPQFFKSSGYRTAIFGKWHLGSNVPFRPQDRGFDEVLTFPGSHIASAPDWWENDYWKPKLLHNGEWKPYSGFCTDIWFEESMKWIEENSKFETRNSKPFFLYLPLNAAHGPYWCPHELRKKYEQRGLSGATAQFYGLIDNVDQNVGCLLRFLEANQLDQNTLLVFTSDNGTAFGDKVFNADMHGKKRSLYEGGHRVPLFIRWPGHLTEPQKISEPVQTQDLLPTLLDLAGISASDADFDGISFAQQIRSGAPFPERKLVVQYGNDSKTGGHRKYDGAVLWNQWRLVKNSELYNLANDPCQQTNVVDRFPEVAQALREHYEIWWATVQPFAYSRIQIGTDQEPITHLSSKDWAYAYCDDPGNLRRGTSSLGEWKLFVKNPGTYSIKLLRWPIESGLAISAGAPKFTGKYGSIPEGAALPIVAAKISIAGQTMTVPVHDGDRSADFTVELEAGETELATRFLLKNGKSRCSAYYAIIEYLQAGHSY